MVSLRGLIVLLLLTSCGNYKQKILKKYCIQDTIKVTTSVIVPSIQVDTLFSDTVFSHIHDTLIITKDKLVIKYFRNTQDGTVYLGGAVKSDTIYVKIKVPCNQINKPLNRWQFFVQGVMKFFSGVGLLAFLVMLIFLLFKK